MNLRFTPKEQASVERLLPYAASKPFIADLLINGYNDSTPVNLRQVMRYAAGEPSNSTYAEDVAIFLGLMVRGVETHELIGSKKMKQLLTQGSESGRSNHVH